MAITTSAKKAHRQSIRRGKLNDSRRAALRAALKLVRTGQKGDAKALAAAYKAIDKAVKRGLMKKNTAARRKAKVSKLLKPQSL
jgi:small subunit ribosomal protein S20